MSASQQLALCDYSQMKLPELASHIWTEADKAKSAMTSAAEHAIRCGSALMSAKEKVPHGSWMKWLNDNTQLSQSTANTYMRVAEANSQRAVNLESIRGALKLLAQDKLEARSDFSEDYVPHDGEELPLPPPAAASAFKAKSAAPVVVEAEIVEPAADDDDGPPALVVDTTKPDIETDGKEEKIGKYTPQFGLQMADLAKRTLDRILPNDTQLAEALEEVIEYAQGRISPNRTAKAAQIDMTNGEGGFPAVIAAMLPHLSKDELSKVMEAAVLQWETLTGGTAR
jgi:hypothetical protein